MLPFPVPPIATHTSTDLGDQGSRVAVPALAWDDLPAHRRLTLVWYLAATSQARSLRHSDQPCPVGRLGQGTYPKNPSAVRGTDGRFHLLEAGSDSPCGVAHHNQWCHWSSNGHDYRIQPPPLDAAGSAEWTHGSVDVRWPVKLTGETREPAAVERIARCPVHAPFWPPPITVGVLGPIRATLVERFGAQCAACKSCLAVFVDHDAVSGLARGYLCRDCNTQVEACLHVTGCIFADYLNQPPGSDLGLRYPRNTDPGRLARARALLADSPDLLALLDAAVARRPNPRSRQAAPPHAVGADSSVP
ncbi:endonuclease domain-containing protein [Cellulomonas sp. URHB0016]